MALKESSQRYRNIEHEGNKHPHPVAMQNLPARSRIEIGLHPNIEKPCRAAQQWLLPGPEASADACPPPEEVNDQDILEGGVWAHLLASFLDHAQLVRRHAQNLARGQSR